MKLPPTALVALHGLLALTLFSAAAAHAAEQITWGWFNTVPHMITEGPNKEQGIFDLTRIMLMHNMSDYGHKVVNAPFPRVFHEIKSGNTWCFVGATKSSEREKFALFSVPAIINLPHKIIVPRGQAARYSSPQSLEALLVRPQLRTSVLRERAINPVVDALLRQHPPVQQHSEFEESIRMLLAGRLDYLVETQLVVDYFTRQSGQAGELLAFDIKEFNEPNYFHVMCPKTPWGRRVIDDVNQVLRAQRPTPAYRAILEKWSSPDAARQIRAVYDGGFLRSE